VKRVGLAHSADASRDALNADVLKQPRPAITSYVESLTYCGPMGNAANPEEPNFEGATLLARDLTPAELLSVPVLASAELLLVEGLSADEDDAFAAALDS